MIESVHICDICGRSRSNIAQSHSAAQKNADPSLNNYYSDVVRLPPGWAVVCGYALCTNCVAEVKEQSP